MPPTTTSTPPPPAKPTSTGGDPKIAGAAITQFGNELFKATRDSSANTVVSPVSVGIALAMLERGATGDAQQQLAAALHITDANAFHASVTELTRHLLAAKPTEGVAAKKPGELEIAIANALFTQAGYPIRAAYTAELAEYYGPALRTVDFTQRSAVDAINQFVSDGTRKHIPKVLERVDDATKIALVNTLFMKASWREPFDAALTTEQKFTPLSGSPVDVKMMQGRSFASKKGDGWLAARLLYTGSLFVDFVLPDESRFDEIANKLPTVFDEFANSAHGGNTLALPRFTTSFKSELKPALTKLGIVAPYAPGNLLGITDDRRLALDQAIHATFLTMNETGTEAAAATVLTAVAVSAPATPPPPVVLDRPFFFRIADFDTGATLFVGQVLNPTA